MTLQPKVTNNFDARLPNDSPPQALGHGEHSSGQSGQIRLGLLKIGLVSMGVLREKFHLATRIISNCHFTNRLKSKRAEKRFLPFSLSLSGNNTKERLIRNLRQNVKCIA